MSVVLSLALSQSTHFSVQRSHIVRLKKSAVLQAIQLAVSFGMRDKIPSTGSSLIFSQTDTPSGRLSNAINLALRLATKRLLAKASVAAVSDRMKMACWRSLSIHPDRTSAQYSHRVPNIHHRTGTGEGSRSITFYKYPKNTSK